MKNINEIAIKAQKDCFNKKYHVGLGGFINLQKGPEEEYMNNIPINMSAAAAEIITISPRFLTRFPKSDLNSTP
jgi:hypothetical protein